MNNFVLAVFAIISCSFYITSGAAIGGGCDLPPAQFRQAYPPPSSIVGDIFKDISLKDSDVVNPRNCKEIYDSGIRDSGIYVIYVGARNLTPYKVYCDMSLPGGGWTVIIKRKHLEGQQINFNRKWNDYARGFGEFNKEFMMGLELMHHITHHDKDTKMELFIGMQKHDAVVYRVGADPCDVYRYARYSKFNIGDSTKNYELHIDGYDSRSTAGDSLTEHNNKPFSTIDRDNDSTKTHCADKHGGGWWYHNCRRSQLTGVWTDKPSESIDGIIWSSWHTDHDAISDYSLKSVIMAIRPVDN